MLGGFHDAEDLVQETLLRAWRGLGGFQFEGWGSFRSWLYRIATNACLTALASRARRLLPEMLDPPADRMPEGGPATEIPWLEPYPDMARHRPRCGDGVRAREAAETGGGILRLHVVGQPGPRSRNRRVAPRT